MEKPVKKEWNLQRSKKQIVLGYFLDALFYLLGSLAYAVAINVFSAPNNIAPGGFTGIATMLNYLLGLPIGVMTIALNLPLFIWGFIRLGKRAMVKTVIGTVLSSVVIDLTAPILPQYVCVPGEVMLACIFGGVLAGVGLGFVFMRGGTTGGTDLVAKLVSTHVKFISLGRLVLLADCVVILMTFIVYQNLSSPLYALIFLFVHSKVIDAVLYGVDSGRGKMMLIISPKNQEIKDYILTEVSRGVTELMSRGGYSGIEGEVLLVAVRRQEVYRTYDVIKRVDPKAFVIVANADQISGLGFREKDDV